MNAIDVATHGLEGQWTGATADGGVDLLDERAVTARAAVFGEVFTHNAVDIDRPASSLVPLGRGARLEADCALSPTMFRDGRIKCTTSALTRVKPANLARNDQTRPPIPPPARHLVDATTVDMAIEALAKKSDRKSERMVRQDTSVLNTADRGVHA